tara:strand:- start:37 stop:462 length:426 start_codon:yes stop_codon:yes gene_type:complete
MFYHLSDLIKSIEVVAAIIIYQGKFLCCQRGDHKFSYIANRFEFPGGKIEQGEIAEDALKREIKEELNLEIMVNKHVLKINHQYPDFNLIMDCFLCSVSDFQIKLNDHISYKLVDLNKLKALEWVPADIELVDYLIENNIG